MFDFHPAEYLWLVGAMLIPGLIFSLRRELASAMSKLRRHLFATAALDTVTIHLMRDSDAEVFIATCESLPGFVAENPEFAGVMDDINTLVPDLAGLNQIFSGTQNLKIRIAMDNLFAVAAVRG